MTTHIGRQLLTASTIEGTAVQNAAGEDLGEILEVIEQPHQVLCAILLNGKEALIPIHEDSLEKVDAKNRKVYVSLPDGLLEIYR